MKERYKLMIEPITPVHIGTGIKLNPLDYKIVKTNIGNNRYARFSSDSILNRIAVDVNKSREFDNLVNTSDMKGIQRFFHENFTQSDLIYLCSITSVFESKYNVHINEKSLKNACEVEELYRSGGTKNAVIPGSSIKGAIRTALLDMCRDTSNNFDFQRARKNKYFQNDLFDMSDAKNAPLRCISVSDCMFENNKIQMVGSLQIIDCTGGYLIEKNNSQIWAEIIQGSLMESVRPEEFIISIDKKLQKATNLKKEKQIKKSFTIDDIKNECNYFFGENFKQEYNHFYKNEQKEKYELIHNLKNQINKIVESEDSFVLRIGRWSQFEFVTLYDENKKMGKTRTLFDYNGQYLPMGWCKCTIKKLP